MIVILALIWVFLGLLGFIWDCHNRRGSKVAPGWILVIFLAGPCYALASLINWIADLEADVNPFNKK